MAHCVSFHSIIFCCRSPHPNDESSSLINFEPHDGVAPQSRFAPLGGATNHKSTSSLKVASVAAMDRPHDYDPLRKDGYRSPPTPDTPSNWKPMQCHPDSHNTETLYPAVAPDSMQYWTGMLGILLDGSSSPSVYVDTHSGTCSGKSLTTACVIMQEHHPLRKQHSAGLFPKPHCNL